MSSPAKIDFETFYTTLKTKFPRLQTLTVWKDWDYSNESVTHSVIMSELAAEMIIWATEENYDEVAKLLSHIERAFEEATNSVIAFIGTDFTVTILECKDKTIRENIKKLMGKDTAHAYQMNLRGYSEPN
jgi:hypothetical protein